MRLRASLNLALIAKMGREADAQPHQAVLFVVP